MPQANQSFALEALVDSTLPCDCGVEHTIPTRAIAVGSGVLAQVATYCKLYLSGQRLLLVADDVTYAIAGERVQTYIEQAGYGVEPLLLTAAEQDRVHADDATIARARGAIHAAIDGVVAVGAGTVNDVAKLASFQVGRPYLVCPTAPSVNGFTSAIAAIMSQGVKRTVPAQLPVAVVADTDILATAPAVMTRAGLGDLLSKSVSSADWKLAHLIKGEYFCDLPIRMVTEAERACRDSAVAIGRGDVAGAEALTRALLLSGFSMAVAGSSSPASGGEHLISHYWDMTAHWHGRSEGLHGAQVGVATLVTATLYEKLQALDPSTLSLATLHRDYPTWETLEQHLRDVHGPLAEAVIPEARKKYLPLTDKAREWEYILNQWQTVWQALRPQLVPAASMREVLCAAGAPVTVRDLGISALEMRTALLHAKDIRGRYTVLDFAHDLGVLASLCDEVLEESGVLEGT
jgi:glycerol-1-phosphate dehydrogenase [NAD(P)+]